MSPTEGVVFGGVFRGIVRFFTAPHVLTPVKTATLWLLLELADVWARPNRVSQMITDVFASSFPHFYRSRVFSRSLTRAIFHTILAISLLEVVRVGAFYEANRAAFARLDLHRIASELDNFPDRHRAHLSKDEGGV